MVCILVRPLFICARTCQTAEKNTKDGHWVVKQAFRATDTQQNDQKIIFKVNTDRILQNESENRKVRISQDLSESWAFVELLVGYNLKNLI